MVVVVGSTLNLSSSTDSDFIVARYDLNGNLDTAFGDLGVSIIDFYAEKDDAVDVLINADNKIVVVGHVKDHSHVVPGLFGGPLDFGLAQLTEEGALDHTFGDLVNPNALPDDPLFNVRTGKVSTDLGRAMDPTVDPILYSTDESWAGALDMHGRIVVAGRYGTKGVSDFTVVRYTPIGTLDTNFGTNGVVTRDILGGPDAAYDVAMQTTPVGQKIVIAGRASSNDKFQFAMIRHNSDGSPDLSFGDENGNVLTRFEEGPDQANSVAILPGNRIMLGGWAKVTDGMVDFGMACYTEVGTPLNPSLVQITGPPIGPHGGGGGGGGGARMRPCP